MNHDHPQENITPHEESGRDEQASADAQDKRRHDTDVARGIPAMAFGLGTAALAGVIAVTGPAAVQPDHATEPTAHVITVRHYEVINEMQGGICCSPPNANADAL